MATRESDKKVKELQPPDDLIYRFDGFRLEPLQRRLRDASGREIELTPRHFDTLHQMVKQPGELITRETLIKFVWHDSVVSDGSLTQAISNLRRALGDTERSLIVTVPKVGYRFTGTVEVEARQKKVLSASSGTPAAGGSRPGRLGAGDLSSDSPATVDPTSESSARPLRSTSVLAIAVMSAALVALVITRGPCKTQTPSSLTVTLEIFEASREAAETEQNLVEDDLTGIPTQNFEAAPWIRDAALRLLSARLQAHPSLRLESSPTMVEQAPKAHIDRQLRFEVTRLGPEAASAALLRLAVYESGIEPVFTLQRSTGLADLVSAVHRLTSDLARRLNVDSAPDAARELVPVEALRDYTEGLRQADQQQLTLARESLEAAVHRAPNFGLAHLALAEVLHEIGYQQLALSHAKAALDLEGVTEDRISLRIRARYHEIAGDWQAACLNYQRAFERFGDEEARLPLIRCLIEVGQPRLAQRHLEEAKPMDGDSFLRVDAILVHSDLKAAFGEYGEAAALAQQAIQLAATNGLERRHLEALRRVARFRFYAGDRHAALETMRRAAALFHASGDVLGGLKIEQDLTAWSMIENDPETAHRIFLEHLEVARSLGHTHLEAQTLARLGSVLGQMGRIELSLERFDQALELFVDLGNKSWQERIRTDMARRLISLGEMDLAAAELKDLLATQEPGSFLFWYLHNELTFIDRVRGRFSSAREHGNAALEAAVGDSVTYKWRYSLCEHASVLMNVWELDRAASRLEECRRLALAEDDSDLDPLPIVAAYAELHLATLAILQGRTQSARFHLKTSVELIDQIDQANLRNGARVELALVALLAGEDKAVDLDFLATMDPGDESRLAARLNVARALQDSMKGRLASARRWAQEARTRHRPSDWATTSLLLLLEAALGEADTLKPSSDGARLRDIRELALERGDRLVLAITDDLLRRVDAESQGKSPEGVVLPRYPSPRPGF